MGSPKGGGGGRGGIRDDFEGERGDGEGVGDGVVGEEDGACGSAAEHLDGSDVVH